jgi:hypothetical protein
MIVTGACEHEETLGLHLWAGTLMSIIEHKNGANVVAFAARS